jgi:hypothetical protein
MRSVLVSLVVALLAVQVQASAPDAFTPVRLNQVFTVGVKEWFGLTAQNWAVRVTGVQDSRCPVNVDCYWAGDAAVTLAIGAGTTKPRSVVLHTAQNIGPNRVQHRGVALELLKLEPANGELGPLRLTFRFCR